MWCKVKQSIPIVYIFLYLLLTIQLSGQSFTSHSAPAGHGDQILQELLHYEDTILISMQGNGYFNWESVEFSYPESATLLFKTTIIDKYPLNHLIFYSGSGKVRIRHLLDTGSGFLITGNYLNSLKIGDIDYIENTSASSGIFILKTDYNLNVQDITHYEGGIASLPYSLHISDDKLFLPLSVEGKFYADEEYEFEKETLVLIEHSLDDLAYANVQVQDDMGSFHIGDNAWRGDTLYLCGEFKDSISTISGTVYNPGFNPDPVILKYLPDTGLFHAYSLGGSYLSYADRIIISGDTTIVGGNFMGGLNPKPGETVSIGESSGIYMFYYIDGKYRDAQVLSSDAFLYYYAAELIKGRLLISFSFIGEFQYKGEKISSVPAVNSYSVFKASGPEETGKVHLIPYVGNGNFRSLAIEDEEIVVFGTCDGELYEEEELTDGYDIIHLRKQNKTHTIEPVLSEDSFLIYPQPAGDRIWVKGENFHRIASFGLYGMDGRLHAEGEFTGEIALNSLRSSAYILNLYDKEGRLLLSRLCLVN